MLSSIQIQTKFRICDGQLSVFRDCGISGNQKIVAQGTNENMAGCMAWCCKDFTAAASAEGVSGVQYAVDGGGLELLQTRTELHAPILLRFWKLALQCFCLTEPQIFRIPEIYGASNAEAASWMAGYLAFHAAAEPIWSSS